MEAAIRIAARGRSDGLTGRALGEELGVDRSSVWRHFTDKDALLLAVGDRLLTMALDRVPEGLETRERLETLARAVVETYVAHPYAGAAVSARTTGGPGERAVVDTMLAALREQGLRDEDVPRYYRMLADSVLAYAGMRAGYSVLSEESRARDELAWSRDYGNVDATGYPALAAFAPHLAAIDEETVWDTLMETFWLAIDARVRVTGGSRAPRGGESDV
ncbi:TetR/AcrR family transcriptional regulator [Streptomyces goshikiensis]|uniref:TetR/AcrR family transcriptional regulator n=1 Tax=Streptomyces goshikiensis TaxID=1942 RepID=UPI00364A8146